MAGNIQPIFSKVGDIQGTITLTQAANDYTGQSNNNIIVYQSDTDNGSYIQRLRFKALGTNVATVARIYINEGLTNLASTISAVAGTPTGTASASGGTLQTGTFYAKIQAIDQYLIPAAFSTETAAVITTGPTASIAWAWTAVANAVSYRVFTGPQPNAQVIYFNTTTNSFTQNTATISLTANWPYQGNPTDFLTSNMFYGELSLPATTASASAATIDVDYPMNLALPPGYHILVGLGTTVAAGWTVTTVAGRY